MSRQNSAQTVEFGDNEAPVKRWLIFFVLSVITADLFKGIATAIEGLVTLENPWSWLPETLSLLLALALSFVVQSLLLKRICRTSMRDLILNHGETFNPRMVGVVLGAWILGFLLATLLPTSDDETVLNTIGIVPIVTNAVICLALVWMQTTWEEVLFRATVIRATCGDKISPNKACIAGGVVVSLLFMGAHLLNTEVTSQTNMALTCAMASVYFLSAFTWYMLDVAFGSCLPGCVLHLANNLVGFVLISSPNSMLSTPTILLSTASLTGYAELASELLVNAPVIALIIVMFLRRRKAA